MRSWSVPNAAMEPTSPLSTATQTMFGSVSTLRPEVRAPGDDGPQLTTFRRPASPAVAHHRAEAAVDARQTDSRGSTAPASRNISAWKTLVHTTAFTPPVAM